MFDTAGLLELIFTAIFVRILCQNEHIGAFVRLLQANPLQKPYKRSNLLILTQNPHKYANEKSLFTTQRSRKWFEHVPIGPKHQN